jgi:hypothetical protein
MSDAILKLMKVRPMGLPLMQDAWEGCVHWAMNSDEMVKHFKDDTGLDIDATVNQWFDNPGDVKLSHHIVTLVRFYEWVATNIWGVEPDA